MAQTEPSSNRLNFSGLTSHTFQNNEIGTTLLQLIVIETKVLQKGLRDWSKMTKIVQIGTRWSGSKINTRFLG